MGFGGERDQSSAAEGQGLSQGADPLAGGYPRFVLKSQSISASHRSTDPGGLMWQQRQTATSRAFFYAAPCVARGLVLTRFAAIGLSSDQ